MNQRGHDVWIMSQTRWNDLLNAKCTRVILKFGTRLKNFDKRLIGNSCCLSLFYKFIKEIEHATVLSLIEESFHLIEDDTWRSIDGQSSNDKEKS